MNKLRLESIRGMSAIIQSQIICLPFGCLQERRLKHNGIITFMLSMGVKLGLSHEGKNVG
jgi:hypothetical protein